LPIFFDWVSTWRYRESRAATPTVSRSLFVRVSLACNTAPSCSSPAASGVAATVPLTLCADFAPKRARIDVVDERAVSVDLDHRQPLPIPRLQFRVAGDVDLPERDTRLLQHAARPFAEVAAVRVEEDDVGYG
jgi:hypothetical protein